MRNKSKAADHRAADHHARSGQSADAAVALAPWRRRALSLLLLLHLTAVAIAPFAFAASGPEIRSPVAELLMGCLRPYIQFAFLDHGYFFFAPNPGPSHVLRCTVYKDRSHQQRPALVRYFPDRRRDFPRLFYHRHFMLSEQLNAMFVPPTPPPIAEDSPAFRRWQRERQMYQARRDAFLAHLKWRYQSDNVELARIEHRLLSPAEFYGGMKLSDRSLFIELPEAPNPELIYPVELP